MYSMCRAITSDILCFMHFEPFSDIHTFLRNNVKTSVAPQSRQGAVMKPEDFCGAVRRPVAVHEAPQLGQTPPPELETTVPDAEILPINCMLLILQTGTGADSATPIPFAA